MLISRVRRFGPAVASTLLVTAILAVPALSANPAAASDPPAGERPLLAASALPVTSAAGTAHVVTLPTGDRILVATRGGRTVATRLSGSGPLVTVQHAGGAYVVPVRALPDIGTRYQLSQFAVVAPQPVPTPTFKMYTLHVTGIDANGARDSGNADVILQSVDDGRKFLGVQSFYKGQMAFSVPAGVYSATAVFFAFAKNGTVTMSLVVLPEFTVSGAGQTVTVDARRATTTPRAQPPQPAQLMQAQLTVDRAAAQFGDNSVGIGFDSTAKVSVTPSTKPVSTGSLTYSTQWRFAAASYVYDMDFLSQGVIPTVQKNVPAAGDFATVDASYHSAVARDGFEARFAFAPGQFFAFGLGGPLTQPVERAEYVLGDPRVTWLQNVAGIADATAFAGIYTGAPHVYQPGEQAPEAWMAEPQHPDEFVDTSPPGTTVFCQLCRQGDLFAVAIYPYADNDGHLAFPDDPSTPGLTESAHFQVFRGTKQLLDTNYADTVLPVPAGPGTYRFVYDNTRQAPWTPLSTSTHTEWTFRSTTPTTSSVPPGWVCLDGTAANCAALPLLFPEYAVPVSLGDTVPAGPTSFGLSLTHAQGTANPAAITGVTVSVSYDDGNSWQPAQVTTTGTGRYQVAYTTPAASATNGYVALRTTASDAAGGAVTQTILRAYQLGS